METFADQAFELLQRSFRDWCVRSAIDEAAKQKSGVAFGLRGVADVVEENAVRGRRPFRGRQRSFDLEPLHGNARLTAFRERRVTICRRSAIHVARKRMLVS